MSRSTITHLTGWAAAILVLALAVPYLVQATPNRTSVGDSPRAELHMPPVPPSWIYVKAAGMARFPGIDRTSTMSFIEKYFPLKLRGLKETATRRPNSAVDEMTDLLQETLRLMRIKETRPEMFDKLIERDLLERQAREEASALKLAKADDKDLLEDELKQLRATLDETFKVKQELMNLEVAAIEEDLEELRELIKRRIEHSDVIIKQRLVELSGKADHLQW
jgi:hypothetical protein